jgi:hypothetical protein
MASPLPADEVISRTRRAPAEAPAPAQGNGDGLIGGRPASGPRSARHGSSRTWRRRRRTAVLLVAMLLVAGAGVAAVNLPRHGAVSDRLAASPSRTSQEVSAEDAARAEAVNWILQQVSTADIVSCDSRVCTQLAGRGFPSENLLTLGPTSNDPLGSTLVVDTATVQNQFGKRLGVYAPAVIASFGAGSAKIQIRWVYPGGAGTYRAALPAALQVRKAHEAELLANKNVLLSAKAKAQLRSGQIDPWLPELIAIMAHSHPVSIVDFASQSPGGGPASLMRWVDLATNVPSAHLTPTAYLGWIRSFLDTQRAEYQPAWVQQITSHSTGQTVLRIGYSAPSPLS